MTPKIGQNLNYLTSVKNGSFDPLDFAAKIGGESFSDIAWFSTALQTMENGSDEQKLQAGLGLFKKLLKSLAPTRAPESAATKAQNDATTTALEKLSAEQKAKLDGEKAKIENELNAKWEELNSIYECFKNQREKLTEKQREVIEKKEALDKAKQEYEAATDVKTKTDKLSEISKLSQELLNSDTEIKELIELMNVTQNQQGNVSKDAEDTNSRLNRIFAESKTYVDKLASDAQSASSDVAKVPGEITQDKIDLATAQSAKTAGIIPVFGTAIAADAAAIVTDRTAAISNGSTGLLAYMPKLTASYLNIGAFGTTLNLLGTDTFNLSNGLLKSLGSVGDEISPLLSAVGSIDLAPTAEALFEAAEEDLALLGEQEDTDDNDDKKDDSQVLKVNTDDLNIDLDVA